ncbi:hypothetical protein [Nonomuraea wenchangensis]|uniref:hypothetical protein n=1 Tax=Nonomuraea wenchangensis TaxID=568860 RepID=UPI000B8922C1|nr:hypothetical protein [Nonomuraea wenchangensis]
MDEWAKLIEAIAGLVGAVAWPVAVVVAVWLIMRKHRDAFERLLDRLKTLSYPGGQVDFDAVVKEQQHRVEQLQDEVVAAVPVDGQHREAALQLVEESRKLGAIRTSARLLKALDPSITSNSIESFMLLSAMPPDVAEALALKVRRDLREAAEHGRLGFDNGEDRPPLVLPPKD